MAEQFDMTKIQRGARLKRSPFFEATQRYGAAGYTVYNHMLFPTNFQDFEEEYWHLVNHVTLWDVSVERVVEISGPGAFEFTNRLTPRDLGNCKVGQCKYVLITGQDGGIINDPVLLRVDENRFWLALADSDVLLWAKGLAVTSKLDVDIKLLDVSPLQIQGPKSRQVVQALFGDSILNLPYYHWVRKSLDGIPLIITRTGWTGEVGYEVFLLDSQYGDRLWDRILETGRPFQIAPTGPSDIRRIEAGILNYGADMTLDDNPYEVGLGWMVELNQNLPFIGQNALREIHDQGPEKKLVGVVIEGDKLAFNMTRWEVSVDNRAIGYVTSAVYSPRLDQNIGFAMVPRELSGLGTVVQVQVPGLGVRAASVVRRPFIDPQKHIPKS